MKDTQNVINLTTGDVTYAIRNEFGEEIGAIRFNPADIDIVRRCDAVAKWFSKVDIPKNPTLEQVYEFSDKVAEQFDYLLNRKVSGEIFKVCNPLTLLSDGTRFYVGVLNAVMEILTQTVHERAEKSAERVAEAVAELTENE